MFSIVFAAALAGPAAPSTGIATELARLTAGPCYDLAQAAPAPGPLDIAKRDELVRAFGMEPGLSQKLLNRLGPGGSALVSKAIMGSKSIGEDEIVMAFGGEIPGCSIALFTTNGESREYELVAALVAAGWKEATPGVAQQRGFIGKRMMLRRDAGGRPFLINVMTIMEPGKDFRHAMTVVAIPPHVKLPAGF